jgi:hypothetical protein
MLTSALTTLASAGEINIAWDPAPGATGYRVYYGTAPGVYSSSITTSLPSATITGLQDCTSHYIAVKAINGAGESEQFSNEIAGWPRPAVSSSGSLRVMQGGQAVLDVTGGNFQPGATVSLNDSNILLGSVSVLSCTHLQVLATVEPTAGGVQPAHVGKHDVTIVNPDDVYGLQIQGFEVLINPARFDINKSDSATTNRIDGKDTIYLSRNFGASYPSTDYDPDYDFDGDGSIDGTDLSYIGASFGKCWSSSAGTWSASACPVGLR